MKVSLNIFAMLSTLNLYLISTFGEDSLAKDIISIGFTHRSLRWPYCLSNPHDMAHLLISLDISHQSWYSDDAEDYVGSSVGFPGLSIHDETCGYSLLI